MQEIMNENVES